MLSQLLTSAALLASLPLTLAQTSTDCNPLQKTCPADKGLAQSSYTADFASQDFSNWKSSSNDLITRGSNGAQFQITADGQAPTLTSDFYLFFGRVDVSLQAAPGVGIVSAIVLESDDLDEIDWELLGGDTTQAQSNYFGKGDTSTYDRGAYHPVSTPQTTFHTYSIDWTTERIQWLIDGNVVRQLPYASASGGAKYPQTPSRVKLGSWVAGGASNSPGTVQWAGGKTDFSKAPFNMYVKSISVTNYNPAASYSYGDNSGSWQSIQKSGSVAAGSSSSSSSAVSSVQSTTSTSSSTSSTSSTKTSVAISTIPNKPLAAASSSTSALSSITTTVHSSSSVVVAGSSTLTTIVTPSVSSVAVLPVSSAVQTSSRTSSSVSSTSSAPVQQTGNSAASVGVSTAGSLFGLAAVFLLF